MILLLHPLHRSNPSLDDVANAWATSVSSRSVSYRWAMVLGTIFELLGAITVGSRTAETIKNGIIPNSAFQNNAGVQMMAFTCALAAASTWVMWCTRHSAHVSSTYSLISSVAGVGVATVGASKVQWGWNDGKGLGAIFAGLGMAPVISGCFGAIIFMLIKTIVHMRRNPVPWAVYSSPFWFLVAATVCTLSIVYKGSPNLGLKKKPSWYIAAVTMGCGGGVALLAAIFFVPFVHSRVIKRDHSVKWWMFILGPLLLTRPAPSESEIAKVPNYAVVQDEDEQLSSTPSQGSMDKDPHTSSASTDDKERNLVAAETHQLTYKEIMAQSEDKHRDKLLQGRGPLGWAMRYLRDNPMGAGEIYELRNIVIVLKRIPPMIVCGLLYGLHYDIHTAQSGIAGTPEGARMKRVYAAAPKYPNEVEHTYSFVQVLTACTASFAHGANDIGNSVGPWAAIYSAWSTGDASSSKSPVPVWQLAVLALCISAGLVTYGYNIMKGESLILQFSLSKQSTESNTGNSHGQQNHLPLPQPWLLDGARRRHYRPRFLAIFPPRLNFHVHYRRDCRRRPVQRYSPRRQLPACRALGLGLDYDNSHRWNHWWMFDGPVH